MSPDERFAIGERIGTGATGVVHRGIDRSNGQTVAIKISVAGSKSQHESEAALLQRLEGHPNIVRSIATWTRESQHFLVLENAQRGSLRDVIETNGALSWKAASKYGLDLAAGLQCAHDAGILHRDLKPGNVLVFADDTAKIADFGTARDGDLSRTIDGPLVATLGYIAPEVQQLERATPRSDLYALAMTVIASMTAATPVPGHSPKLPVTCPTNVASVLLRATALDPGTRYSSAGEFAEALRKSTLRPTWSLSTRHRVLAVLGISILLVLVATVAMRTVFAPPGLPPTPAPGLSDRAWISAAEQSPRWVPARSRARNAISKVLAVLPESRSQVAVQPFTAERCSRLPEAQTSEANADRSLRFTSSAVYRTTETVNAVDLGRKLESIGATRSPNATSPTYILADGQSDVTVVVRKSQSTDMQLDVRLVSKCQIMFKG